jgi:hypothetical protein
MAMLPPAPGNGSVDEAGSGGKLGGQAPATFVGVGVGTGVLVGVAVGVTIGVGVTTGVGVGVGFAVGVGVDPTGVAVGVGVGGGVGVGVDPTGVAVGVGVGGGVGVGVDPTGVAVGVGVGVDPTGVAVGVGVGVDPTGVAVGVGVGVAPTTVAVGVGVGVPTAGTETPPLQLASKIALSAKAAAEAPRKLAIIKGAFCIDCKACLIGRRQARRPAATQEAPPIIGASYKWFFQLRNKVPPPLPLTRTGRSPHPHFPSFLLVDCSVTPA